MATSTPTTTEMPRPLVALVAGAVSYGEGLSGERCTACGIDGASVRSAPFHEHVGVYNDLLAKCSSILDALDFGGHPFEPMIVVGLELGIDGEPSRPIFLAHPGNRHRGHLGHLNKSPLVGSEGI